MGISERIAIGMRRAAAFLAMRTGIPRAGGVVWAMVSPAVSLALVTGLMCFLRGFGIDIGVVPLAALWLFMYFADATSGVIWLANRKLPEFFHGGPHVSVRASLAGSWIAFGPSLAVIGCVWAIWGEPSYAGMVSIGGAIVFVSLAAYAYGLNAYASRPLRLGHGRLAGLVMQGMLFAAPVFYPLQAVRPAARGWLAVNPFAVAAEYMRSGTAGVAPVFGTRIVGAWVAVATGVFLWGHWRAVRRLRRDRHAG